MTAGRERRACRRSRGAAAASRRRARSRSAWRVVRAKASTLGVAEPSTRAAPVARARQAATVRRIVVGVVVLLVRGVVLFVDDDQPEVGDRREHRRSRTEHEACAAGRRVAPGGQPLARRQPGVEHRDAFGREPIVEPGDGLTGQPDLGDQDEHCSDLSAARPRRRAGRSRSCRCRSRRAAAPVRRCRPQPGSSDRRRLLGGQQRGHRFGGPGRGARRPRSEAAPCRARRLAGRRHRAAAPGPAALRPVRCRSSASSSTRRRRT